MKDNVNKNDLTAVKGIGPARQKWLGELFDVYSLEALSALSANEVEATAKKAGKILAKGEVADWIAQSKALVTEKVSGVAAKSNTDHTETTSWKPVASFVVEFQQKGEAEQVQQRTKVHYMEVDEEITWPGIEREQLGVWLTRHLLVDESEPETTLTSEEAAPKTMEPKPDVQQPKTISEFLNIVPTQVCLEQEPDEDIVICLDGPERPFLAHVHHENLKTLAIDFELDSPKTDQTLPLFFVQCRLQNLTTHHQTPVCLDMIRDFSAHCLRYRATLPRLAPGIYRMMIFFQGERPLKPTYFELPKLNVL